VFVDDRDDLDRPPVGGDVELEVHCPDPVGRVRDHWIGGGGGAVAFAASPLRHPQPFFTPKPLDLLVIHVPAVSAGVMIGRPETTTGMVLGVLAQPRPQRRIRVLLSGRDGFVSLSGAVLPGHPAGEPFADPQHPLEVTNGRPPAFRA
jgi:hypothetical protein